MEERKALCEVRIVSDVTMPLKSMMAENYVCEGVLCETGMADVCSVWRAAHEPDVFDVVVHGLHPPWSPARAK